jgi:hypothetical protein
MKFNYQTASLEAVVTHISTAASPSVTNLKKYYQSLGNTEMVDKINAARKVLKLQRMADRLALLQAEVSIG